MAEYENVMTIADGDGNEIDCEILDILSYKGKEYIVLLPVDDKSDEPEAVILERVGSDDDNDDSPDSFYGIEDGALLSEVFNEFLRRNKAEFNL